MYGSSGCWYDGSTRPTSAMQVNEETLAQSLAIVNQRGQVIGGAWNETLPPLETAPASARTTLSSRRSSHLQRLSSPC